MASWKSLTKEERKEEMKKRLASRKRTKPIERTQNGYLEDMFAELKIAKAQVEQLREKIHRRLDELNLSSKEKEVEADKDVPF